jgi:ElaA protein
MQGERRCDFIPFDRLTPHELYAALALRDRVFVVQQKITCEPEVDGRDPDCTLVLLWDGDALVGTARLFERVSPVVVGRVAVDTSLQRSGVGSRLMQHINDYLRKRPAELHAQAHLEAWYARMGWSRVGDPFLEAEIWHVTMRRNCVP